MPNLKTSIIPSKTIVLKKEGEQKLNKKAICVFVATGFFLDTDTFYTNEIALAPASIHNTDKNGIWQNAEPWFQWHYEPRNISFNDALDEFTQLFEQIIDTQVAHRKVILPLSGGLDSRTQAVALQYLKKEVNAFSYQFLNGYPETKIAAQLAAIGGFGFQKFEIKNGYLWDKIEQLSQYNQCFSEFTHPRQMAIIEQLQNNGEVFSLGHWGDVLFDEGAPNGLKENQLNDYIFKKIVKKGGLSLAQNLWQHWGLEGNFKEYIIDRINDLLSKIPINHIGAKARAFKSLYWAPRWTSANLSVFEAIKPITLPYYEDKMCQWVCTIPEKHLAHRKLQIAYIKKRNPKVAKVTWQIQRPFNLYTYPYNKIPYNTPYRTFQKIEHLLQNISGRPVIQRNWELQFLGSENEIQLNSYLHNKSFLEIIPQKLITQYLDSFKKEPLGFAHPLSMLLTLSLKFKK